ncbi:MAG TPA: PEP-CTERM sorting domain-containing protein [Pirellulales bacterium]|nr:PEP-CTERM sorting domain-containing protein [Pirellulales bacterium]
MRQSVRKAVLCAATLVIVAAARQAQAGWIIADSINASATPAFYDPGSPITMTWAASQVGWFYTPSTSYDVWEVLTKFGVTDHRLVTVDVYQAARDAHGTLLAPDAGDAPLRSAQFAPQTDALAGGIFAPLTLTANNTYFIGFENVSGLGLNVTADGGATSLAGGLRFGFSGGGYLPVSVGGFLSQPILQFQYDPPNASDAPAAVPEPSSIVLFGFGACVLAGSAAWRRRKGERAATA